MNTLVADAAQEAADPLVSAAQLTPQAIPGGRDPAPFDAFALPATLDRLDDPEATR